MNPKDANITVVVVVVVVIVGVPWGLWLGARALLTWVSSQESQVSAAIIAATASVLAGLGAVLVSQQRSKVREISESHRSQKIDLYTGFIKKVMKVIHEHADDKSKPALVSDTELDGFFREFTTDLVLWGSPGAIRAYAKFREGSTEGASSNIIVVMDDLIRAMREDLGHPDRLLPRGGLIKTFLRNPEEVDRLL